MPAGLIAGARYECLDVVVTSVGVTVPTLSIND